MALTGPNLVGVLSPCCKWFISILTMPGLCLLLLGQSRLTRWLPVIIRRRRCTRHLRTWHLQVARVNGRLLRSVRPWPRLSNSGLVITADRAKLSEWCSKVPRCVLSLLNRNGPIMQLLVLVVRFLIPLR